MYAVPYATRRNARKIGGVFWYLPAYACLGIHAIGNVLVMRWAQLRSRQPAKTWDKFTMPYHAHARQVCRLDLRENSADAGTCV